MKTIFEIFKMDLKQLYKNPLILIVVMGMIFLAGVYAWLNIDSNWNPYNNTSEMPIAVANEDIGTDFLDKKINIGEALTEKLAVNDDVKWVFTDKTDAISGTESGEYYGAIVIPENFTNQITTLFDGSEIKKPKFDFYVNQKKNPVAPIIVDKVIDTIKTQVDKSFVNNVIYEVVDQAGSLPVEATTSSATDDLKEAQKQIGELQDLLSSAAAAASSTSDALKSIQDLLLAIDSNIDNTMEISNYAGAIKDLEDICDNLNNSLNDHLRELNATIVPIENFMEKIDKESELYKELLDLVTKLKTTVANLQNNYVDKLSSISDTTIKNLSILEKNISLTVNSLRMTLDKNNKALDGIISSLGGVSNFVDSTNRYLDSIIGEIDEIVETLNHATESEIYLGLMNLLKNPPEVVADFIADPIETNEIDFYQTNSYGTSMAPFYTALAAWVGCTMSTAVIKTDIDYRNKKFRKIKPYQAFWGRFMLFALIAILQGIVISVGDLVLGVETQNDLLFIASTMLISLVFVTIIYPLVVTFGKFGAGIAVVILVLQVAGSGGTFPIELLPGFFQNVQPFMPFNPALNILRETIGGFYNNSYLINLAVLLGHIVIPLSIGLVFRKPIISVKEKYSKKLDHSHLMGK